MRKAIFKMLSWWAIVFAVAAVLTTPAAAFNPPGHFNSTPLAQSIKHVQPHACGLNSGSFARICRPSANASCLSAVARDVKGYSQPFCEKRQTACSFCLKVMMRCIARIGHGPRNQFSCDECPAKFSRCIGKRYSILER